MSKEFKVLHIHKKKNTLELYGLLLLLPTLAFVLILAFYIKNIQRFEGAAKSESHFVLGKEGAADKMIKVGETQVWVALADNEIKRVRGLSGKESLAENEGMLFVFEQKDIRPSFWMKDMNFAIDIIWINDGKILQIDGNVAAPGAGTPQSELKFYLPNEAIDYVLEVNAGFSEKNNIKAGDSVELNL